MNGCELWKGWTSDCGYGRVRIKGRDLMVHRLAYAQEYGDPGDKRVYHVCENKNCINPRHLTTLKKSERNA